MNVPENFVKVTYKPTEKMKKIGFINVEINGVVSKKPIQKGMMGVFADDTKLHEIPFTIYHWGKRV